MIRHIEYDSNADTAYDRAVNSAAAIGFGYWRLVTEYESPTSFNQKIAFKSVRNALSVRVDPLATESDGSDMSFAFIESLFAREDFKREYPDATANNFVFNDGTNAYSGWLSDATVLVCDYYCIKKTVEDVVLLSNGETGFKSDLIELPKGIKVVQTRKGERRRVMLYKITGVDILERTEIMCKWIPVFPVYGDEVDIEGKVVRSGMIRNAKGPCTAYNVMMSGATEEIALRTKSPYIGAEGFMEGHEDGWAQANNRALPAIEYKPTTVDGVLAPPPARQPMADIPAGMLAMAMHAQDNKKKTMGLFDASLGARGTATSGRQEIAQQSEGDMANSHYSDNLIRSVIHCGRCINCMIPHYYDTERIAKTLREDGTMEYATINQALPSPQVDEKTGAIRTVLNDMTCGEFDITVSAGPAYSTLRQEAAEGMAENMAKNPALWGVIGDLYVKNQDWPGADAMAERIKKTIPPQLLEGEDKDEPQDVIQTPRGPLPVSQVPQVLADLDGQLQAAAQAMEKAQADKAQAEVLKQRNEGEKTALDSERVKIEAFQAETERLKMLADAETDRLKLAADAERERIGAVQAEAQSQREAMKKDETAVPTLDEIARLIEQSRPPVPTSMTIRAPSGQVYEVDMKTRH